ncbi:hypothetical protein FOMPIDRAFT_1021650 [Fomitopsis schrenkii]|uniref:Uncharacterized protein n=1 Tax=Fomitopsis schrenkii TaxID=2126942 RepID=S8EI63_FOMSC|nr:hypothetical protein FOMPIDRAFT_1021650 [Fomitopsis schrenkii]
MRSSIRSIRTARGEFLHSSFARRVISAFKACARAIPEWRFFSASTRRRSSSTRRYCRLPHSLANDRWFHLLRAPKAPLVTPQNIKVHTFSTHNPAVCCGQFLSLSMPLRVGPIQ